MEFASPLSRGFVLMQHNCRRFVRGSKFPFASAFIAIGLLVLIIASAWPQAPVVSAMALIALGATELSIERFLNKGTFAACLLVHCLTYGTLYTLFVCVELGKADISLAAPNPVVAFDFLASLVPMTVAMRRILVAFHQHSASE
jgi:hypothetical protein